MDQQEIISELRERVARLEGARPRKRVFNQQEAAFEANVSVNKLRAEQRAGRIKGVLNGRIWTFTDEAIEQYLTQAEQGAAA